MLTCISQTHSKQQFESASKRIWYKSTEGIFLSRMLFVGWQGSSQQVFPLFASHSNTAYHRRGTNSEPTNFTLGQPQKSCTASLQPKICLGIWEWSEIECGAIKTVWGEDISQSRHFSDETSLGVRLSHGRNTAHHPSQLRLPYRSGRARASANNRQTSAVLHQAGSITCARCLCVKPSIAAGQ